MSTRTRGILLYAVMALLIVGVGVFQSWIVALTILNLCLISAVMALGVNMQWGYAGLFNAGVMGFAALGGIGVVLTSMPPVKGALAAGGVNLGLAALFIILTLAAALFVRRRVPGYLRGPVGLLVVLVGYFLMRIFLDPASEAIEAIDPAAAGYLGGLNLPVLIGWLVGGVFAAGAAWLVGKVVARPALGLPRHRHPRHRRDHPRHPQERELADPRRQERDRPAPADPGRARPAGRALDHRPRQPLRQRRHHHRRHRLAPRLRAPLHRRPPRHPLARRAGAALALGPDDARHPRQPRRRRGHGQGRDPPPPADLRPRLRRRRHRRRHARHPRRPVHPRLLQPAALHLPHLGHGHRRRLRQQLGRRPRRLPHLVRLGDGRARSAPGSCPRSPPA